jgi:hypothetical protein
VEGNGRCLIEALSQHSPGETVTEDSRCLASYWNRVSPDYESSAFATAARPLLPSLPRSSAFAMAVRSLLPSLPRSSAAQSADRDHYTTLYRTETDGKVKQQTFTFGAVPTNN